mmetsp:Transcript_7659/g.12869  ORF Transcript_7659/g.12869 Transcript_7659/m.12869 type:complete len:213 (-) Transcript_7659:194-832(-)
MYKFAAIAAIALAGTAEALTQKGSDLHHGPKHHEGEKKQGDALSQLLNKQKSKGRRSLAQLLNKQAAKSKGRRSLAQILLKKKGGKGKKGGKNEGEKMLEKLFEETDVNGDGLVTLEEITTSLENMLGVQLSEEEFAELEAHFAEADTDGSGSLDLEEALAAFAPKSKEEAIEEALDHLFEKYDHDDSGVITMEEFLLEEEENGRTYSDEEL